MMIQKLSDKQIHEIAEAIDATNDVCYFNPETGEYVLMMGDEELHDNGISMEDDDGSDDKWLDWQKEMFDDVKADMAKIDSWENAVRIERPTPHESFGFMEQFVEEVIPDGEMKERFLEALSRSHPFRNFKDIVDDSMYRDAWFVFKQEELEGYVRGKLGEEFSDALSLSHHFRHSKAIVDDSAYCDVSCNFG